MNLINLTEYYTPWLDLIQSIYEEYGPERINLISKSDLRLYIKQYVIQNSLPVCDSDVYFLAKFMRRPKYK